MATLKNGLSRRSFLTLGGVAALGGAGALLAKHVKRREVVAYPELQSEAVARLEVEDFPAIVAMDCQGGDYYKLGPWQYQREQEGRA